MSSRYVSVVPILDDPSLTSSDVVVWFALCAYCRGWVRDSRRRVVHSKDGCCFPSKAKLADFTRLSRRSVERSLRRLEGLGYVRTDERFNGSGQGANGYTLYPDKYLDLGAALHDFNERQDA